MKSWPRTDFVIDLKEAFQTNEKLYYLYEYCEGGELFDLVRIIGKFTESEMQFFAVEIIEGVSYLHERRVMHRDLKLENCLLDREGHVKI